MSHLDREAASSALREGARAFRDLDQGRTPSAKILLRPR